eukprot:TRINITY_DN29383_c0_g1_i2.p1 TRINITY_DN29383_c0_g1~~TRINITY_DN29383_c0_g1_i2.p1  ORF type:complete len:219 (+),score=24.27 TRINITY_DN29383_c0_g1_i2:46-702(+)
MVASFEVVTDGTDVRRGSGGSDVSHGSFRRLTVATDSFTSNPSQAGDDATASHGTESGLSQTEATENFVVYLVGAGILILPKTMADVGIVAACILMMTAFATTFVCSLMVVACCDRLESMSGSSRGSVVESYEALANSILGAAGTAGVTIAKNCYLLGLAMKRPPGCFHFDGCRGLTPMDGSGNCQHSLVYCCSYFRAGRDDQAWRAFLPMPNANERI